MEFEVKSASIECGLGHACTFCPQEVTCSLEKSRHNRVLIENRLSEINQIIIVLSNKGGVGKSTVSTNLAAGLALRGFRVGVADADIHGPNQSVFFGFAESHTKLDDAGLKPLEFSAENVSNPVRIGSLAFLMDDDTTPIVWRDAYKHDFIHHLVGSFNWNSLDFLIVDMPPGTGNELITLSDMLEGSNLAAVLVTTPQAVAQMDTLKAARFCKERGIPIVGAVENMAGVICPHCNGEFHIFPNDKLDAALRSMGVEKLTSIPLAPELALRSDSGEPVVTSAPKSAVAATFGPLIEACVRLGQQSFDGSVAHGLHDAFSQNLANAELMQRLASLPEGGVAMGKEIAELLDQELERLRSAAIGGRTVP